MLIIGITNYNKEKYITQCLDSLYQQIKDDDDIKIIYVDDCSTDNSIFFITNHPIFKKAYFTLIRNDINKWVSEARNQAIRQANKGDWITFIDSDDYVLKNYISTLKTYMNNGQYDVYVFDYENHSVKDDTMDNEIVKANNEMAWSRLYKADFLIENNLFFNDKFKIAGYGEDGDFNNRIIKMMPKIKYTNDIIYGYHWGVENSLSCEKK